MQRWIMHIDMDAFYASVEQRDNPELAGLPVIIGGSKRGVVSAASYEARRFGVKSAMPVFQAKRLCPQGVYLPARMARYIEVSHQIMTTLERFSPLVEKASVDEAYLDATGLTRVFGPIRDMALTLKASVYEAVGLRCSVGLAPVKFLAKIASDINKPDGLTILPPEDLPAFLQQLPVERIPGIGAKTLPLLHSLGVHRAAEVTRFPREFWIRKLGKGGGVLYERAQGIDPRPVVPDEAPKSESAENTFPHDIDNQDILKTWMLKQSERVGASLRRQRLKGRTVTVKVKYGDFTGVTRSKTLEQPTNLTLTIYETAVALFDELAPKAKLRLIGVGVSHFGEEHAQAGHVQLSLLPAPHLAAANGETAQDPKRRAALDSALDTVRQRFGKDKIQRGKLFGFDPEA